MGDKEEGEEISPSQRGMNACTRERMVLHVELEEWNLLLPLMHPCLCVGEKEETKGGVFSPPLHGHLGEKRIEGEESNTEREEKDRHIGRRERNLLLLSHMRT